MSLFNSVNSTITCPNNLTVGYVNGTSFFSGETKLKGLILEDEVTGREWRITISDGQLKATPLSQIDIRNQKLDDILIK